MRNVKHLLIVIAVSAGFFQLHAQDPKTLEYLQQQEQRKKAELLHQLDSGVYYMDIGEHTLADQKFRFVLQHVKSVPSDLAFYFGKNSYYLENYKQSIDWLNKYIQLKGTTGQFSKEADVWLRKAENGLISQRNNESKKAEEVLSKNFDIDCGPSGKVSCPVCKGDHVITTKGPFGDKYQTCPYCNEHGILTCDEYNKLLRGELQRKN